MFKTIRHCDTGNLVRVAQLLTGFKSINAATDQFDADFVAHVCTWQRSRNLSPDGIIGPKTWTALAAEAPLCSTSKNRTSAYTQALQILLDGANLEADGIFGSKTKAAVSAYQASRGLKVDGVCGPKTWAALITGTATTSTGTNASGEANQTTDGEKTINRCVHYLQWDKRWKNVKYSTHTSEQTIGNSGCGPSSMAMIMATFIDPSITPVEMCAVAVEGGFRSWNSGTDWGFFQYVFKKYAGFKRFIPTDSVATLKSALAQGALAVCSVNSGDKGFWTKGGHFITVIGYDADGYIYANDPNKSDAPRKQLESKFKTCMRQAFIFWPEAKEESADSQDDSASAETVRGDAIIDISKWQPTVDYDRFVKATALIILRAGYHGTGGSIKIDERFNLHADALKERGASFGVYFYSIATDEDAAREEARMFYKWAHGYHPLFWALDAEKNEITHDAIAAFVDELRKLGADRVGCYVAHHLYQKYDYETLRGLFDFTWLPRYGQNDGTIEGSKRPDYDCDLWQYTSTGSVDGIDGNVDANVITGTGKSLSWFAGGDT